MSVHSTRLIGRNLGIEWMKLFAIVAIAFQHTSENPKLASIVMLTNFGVPAFVLVSCWFALDSGTRQKDIAGLAMTGARRFLQLYGLFLLWNGMVFLLRTGNNFFVSKSEPLVFDSDRFFLSAYGNALWFLPFIAGANLLCYCTGYLMKKKENFAIVATIVAFAIGMGLMFWKGFAQLNPPDYFLSVSRKALPSMFLGIGIFGFFYRNSSRIPSKRFLVTSSILLAAVGAYGISFISRELFLWETLIGCGVALFAASIPCSQFRNLNPSLSLWIYLAHAPVIQITKDVLRVVGYHWPSGSPVQEILAFLLFIGMLVFCYWLLSFLKPLKSLLLLARHEKPQIKKEQSLCFKSEG